MTKREKQILSLIKNNHLISQNEIAERIGISRSAVAGHIMRLRAKGIIQGRAYVISKKPAVIVIGGANVDISASPDLSLEMGDSTSGEITISSGGVARNIAENLARFGHDCIFIGAVGVDKNGDFLKEQGESVGINMNYLMRLDSNPTPNYVSILDENGEMVLAINDMSLIDILEPKDLISCEKLFHESSLTILDTNMPNSCIEYVINNNKSAPLFVDAVSSSKAKRIKPYLKFVHTLKLSRRELFSLTNVKITKDDDFYLASDLIHRSGVERIFVTLGEKGVFYSDGITKDFEPSLSCSKDVVNSSGSGDAFVAALVHSWLKKWDLTRTVRYAIAASHISLLHRETINPEISECFVNKVYKDNYGSN